MSVQMHYSDLNRVFDSLNISLSIETDPTKIFYPEEEILLKNTLSKKRKIHVIAGRSCAHLSIKKLFPEKDSPILRGYLGEPLWPDGIVGSISHTENCFAAAVASKDNYINIGIDVERYSSVFENIRPTLIADQNEIDKLIRFMDQAHALWHLFSLKESFIKCFSPFLKMKLGFNACKITSYSQNGSFTIVSEKDDDVCDTMELKASVFYPESDMVLTLVTLRRKNIV